MDSPLEEVKDTFSETAPPSLFLLIHTGNLLGVKEIAWKKILQSLLILGIESVFLYFLIGEIFSLKTIITIAVSVGLAPSLFYLIFYGKDLIRVSKSHFKMNPKTIFGILFELILLIAIYLDLRGVIPVFFLVAIMFFWGISGYIRILSVQRSFLFEEDINRVRKVFVLYGYNRLSYFLIFFIYLLKIYAPIQILSAFVIYFPLLYILAFFITNLLPYATKSIKVEHTLKVLRYIKENNPSLQEISSYFDKFNKKELSYTIQILYWLKFIEKRGRKFFIREMYLS